MVRAGFAPSKPTKHGRRLHLTDVRVYRFSARSRYQILGEPGEPRGSQLHAPSCVERGAGRRNSRADEKVFHSDQAPRLPGPLTAAGTVDLAGPSKRLDVKEVLSLSGYRHDGWYVEETLVL